MRIIVIGGICIDVSGLPYAPLLVRDSNPGSLAVSAGGVGFNVARRLSALGHDASMLCAVGGDVFGSELRRAAEAGGVRLWEVSCARTGAYLCVNDPSGDMYVAISDLGSAEAAVTPQEIGLRLADINACDACVVDCNLSEDALEFIAGSVTVPIFADTVSVHKAHRLLPIMHRLTAVKPNIYEARSLTGESAPTEAAAALVRLGAASAFVSCGADGMAYADSVVCGSVPAAPVRTGITTGAGDAAAAMLIHSILNGSDTASAAAEANRFAADVISQEEKI